MLLSDSKHSKSGPRHSPRGCTALSPSRARRWALLLVAGLIYLLLYHLPDPPKFENNTRADRPPPEHDVEVKPRFLYQSPYRAQPDAKYEAQLDYALRRIEMAHRASSSSGGGSGGGDNDQASDTIWQIMLGNHEDLLEDRGADSVLFEEQNPDWTHRLMTTPLANDFVKEVFSTIPDLWEAYDSYPEDVQRADLLRYLLLWYYGGFYSDMDVIPVRPIKECPALAPVFASTDDDDDHAMATPRDAKSQKDRPQVKGNHEQFTPTNPTHNNISLVIGVEIDEPYASPRLMRDWHWSRSYGFIQYAMYAPRRFSPVLRKTIVRVIAHTKEHQSGAINDSSSWLSMILQIPPFLHPSWWFGGGGGRGWGGGKYTRYDEKTVLEVTGPGVFTDAVLDTLSETLSATHELVRRSRDAEEHARAIEDVEEAKNMKKSGGDTQTQRYPSSFSRVTWAPFHRLQDPIWIDATEADDHGQYHSHRHHHHGEEVDEDGDLDGDGERQDFRSASGFGGLGILPINVWGNGQRHSGAENFESVHACINHRFGRTWKKGWWEYLFG